LALAASSQFFFFSFFFFFFFFFFFPLSGNHFEWPLHAPSSAFSSFLLSGLFPHQ
jgi:hypothetical protein